MEIMVPPWYPRRRTRAARAARGTIKQHCGGALLGRSPRAQAAARLPFAILSPSPLRLESHPRAVAGALFHDGDVDGRVRFLVGTTPSCPLLFCDLGLGFFSVDS
jgi:hypothetical protein